MLKKMHFSLLITLCCAAVSLPAAAQDARLLAADKDKTSYAIGLQTARNLRKDGTEVDPEWVIRGLRDGFSSERPLLSEKETKQLMQALMSEVRQKMVANKRDMAAKNRLKGEEFLAANLNKEGVKALPSGVQYRVIKAGSGRKPNDNDVVLCNYRGTLLDGSEFDATLPERPAAMKLSQMIPGWKDALKNMEAGAHWQVFIPSALAYGERGVGTEIGPNEVLVFDIEFLEIK